MKVLNLILDPQIRDSLNFALESELRYQILPVVELTGAMGLLLTDKDIDVVIVEHSDKSKNFLKVLFSLAPTASVFIWTGNLPYDPSFYQSFVIVGSFGIETPIREILHQFETRGQKANPEVPSGIAVDFQDEEFCRIRSDLVWDKKLVSDIYLRLGPKKFLKIYLKGQTCDSEEQKKRVTCKGVDFLYVKREDSQLVLSLLESDLKQRLLGIPASTPEDVAEVSASVLDVAHSMMKSVGLTPEVREVIRSSILLVVSAATRNPRLRSVISRLATDRTHYISSHSTLLAQLACSIAAAIDWGSSQTFQKLTMAAFLHDITVQDERLAHILKTRMDLEAGQSHFSKEALREIELHPVNAAELISKFPEILPDVDTIILQHHETPDGRGFPRGIKKSQIAPLSAIFIVAHDVLDAFYEQGKDFNLEAFIRSREKLYDSGNFRKVLSKLKDMGELSELDPQTLHEVQKPKPDAA